MDHEKIRLAEAAKLLEDRLKKADIYLRFQSTLINVLGIFITIITIGIPLSAYLYVKDLNERVTSQISKHLHDDTQTRIEHAIGLLAAEEMGLRFKGLTILETTLPQLNEKQTLDLIKHAEASKDQLLIVRLQYVLSFQENLAVTQYYKLAYFDDSSLFDKFPMLVYLVKVDSDYLLEKFTSVKDKAEYFLQLVNAGKQASQDEFVVGLLNDMSTVNSALEAMRAEPQNEAEYKRQLLLLMDNISGGKNTYCYQKIMR